MSSAMTPQEIQFIRSLRRAMAKAGSDVRLVDKLEPIADPKQSVGATQVQEPRQGYWLQNATFSRARNGAYPAAAGTETLLEARDMPGPPRGRGVTLTRRDYRLNPASTNLNFYIYAQLQFGIGGSMTSCLVDWNNNVLNVPASTIRVNAVFTALDTQSGAFPYNVGDPIEVGGDLGCLICTDPLVSKGWNTYTQHLADPSVAIVDVPQFAVGFWMVYPAGTALTGLAKTVNMYTSNVYNGVPGPISIGTIPSQQILDNGISVLNSVPSNCRQLDFSQSGLPTTRKALIWALSI